MGLEILCQFVFESSDETFENPKNNSLDRICFRTFLYFHCCDPKLKVGSFINIPACRAKSTLQNELFEFFLSFDKASELSLFLNPHF